MMYSSFNEIAADNMSDAAYDPTAFNPVENAINPADSYRQQSNLIPPVEPTATIPQQLPKQEPDDPEWGWKEQRAWNAKIEKNMATKADMQQGFSRLEQMIQNK